MGDIQIKDPHVKRSSGMAFALKWSNKTVRLTVITAAAALLASLLFATLLYGASMKAVTVIVNGEEQQVETRASSVSELLASLGVAASETDRISVPLTAEIKNGDTIEVKHATPIRLIADGEQSTAYTVGKTVSEALADLQVSLGPEDRVEPDLNANITQNEEIRVIRVTKETEEVKEEIPFGTVRKNDGSLPKGKEKIVQNGKEGELVRTVQKVYEDGVLVDELVLAEEKTDPVHQVVAVGTKKPVAALNANSPEVAVVNKNGVTFAYKQVLTNVTLTAYSNDDASTSGGKWNGITASGTKTVEGRTIAVDPNVIPIGWWVYIEGIGFRRAEDTGGAIKGNKIDVFFDSSEYAKKFGIKRGYKVYIIGKEKPAID
ncbi:hypothetical protein GCM10027018_28270 [Paenibacillus thermoaerophilus]